MDGNEKSSVVVFRVGDKEECWNSCDAMREGACKYVGLYIWIQNPFILFKQWMQNKDLSATWINEYCRNKNDGKCTIKLKCENQSPVCTCTSKVICSAPRKHTSDKSSKGFKKLLKTGRIKNTHIFL